MIKQGTPTPFVVNESNKCLFLVKNEEAQHFISSNNIQTAMGLNYVLITHVKDAHESMCASKTEKTR